nr:hypothetical protein L203_05200 [Cryptococcus depauperatus CBS 7841]
MSYFYWDPKTMPTESTPFQAVLSVEELEIKKPPYIYPSATPNAKDATALREAKRTFGIISQSLSQRVHCTLSEQSRSFTNPNPVNLWEMKSQYSAVQIWKGATMEDEDPTRRMVDISSTFLQIRSARKSSTDEYMIAYAMALELPESIQHTNADPVAS